MAVARIVKTTVTRNLIFEKINLLNKCSYSSKADWIPKPEPTHTNQQWDADDYRNVRFVDKPKHVNQNFAVKLINEVPPKPSKERIVWCDGGGGPIGHPKVYINLDKPGNHICGYCGLRFVKEGGSGGH